MEIAAVPSQNYAVMQKNEWRRLRDFLVPVRNLEETEMCQSWVIPHILNLEEPTEPKTEIITLFY